MPFSPARWPHALRSPFGALRRMLAPKAEAPVPPNPTGLEPAVARFADTLAEPCLLVDARGVLVYCNRAAASRFPKARAGDPLAFTLRNPELLEAIETARRQGQPRNVELHLTVPNQTWYRVSVAPYAPDSEPEPQFVVLTLTDLTEQKRADRMRADFVANASHELRTPLTSLIGVIETLRGPAARDAAARTRFLAIMSTQAGRMSALIDDLLSLSRIEARQHIRPTEPVDLGPLIRETAAALEARLKESGVTLSLSLPETPAIVRGDRGELVAVIENLLDNAVKYGAGGGRIELDLSPSGGRSGSSHALTITDFGPGIPAQHVPRLTERFYRADAAIKGTGLGLAIVKHIVSRHHGTLAIRSEPGKGTSVEILLPE